MAIIINTPETSFGVAFPQSYARIMAFTGDKNTITARVAIYATEAARLADANPVDFAQHQFDVASIDGPLLSALYAALKTLPQYAGAVDC